MKINYLRKLNISKLKVELIGKRKRNNKVKRNAKNNSTNSYCSIQNFFAIFFIMK